MSKVKVGTRDNPLRDVRWSGVAGAILENEFTSEAARRTLLWRAGTWWVWYGGMWKKMDEEQIQMEVYRLLGDLWYEDPDEEGVVERVKQNKGACEEVMFALRTRVECRAPVFPVWLDGREEPKAEECVAFQDVILWVRGDGVEVVGERDETWFGPVLPCAWDPGAECPLWEKCLQDWNLGEEDKGNLRRFLGYLLMGRRDQRKSLLLQGVAGGGKGVVKHVVRHLVGSSWFRASDIQTIIGGFGLAGLQDVSVLAVEEMGDEGKQASERFASVWKQLLGEDSPPLNEKYEKIRWNTSVRVGVVMSSNGVPRMANQGQGVSNKLVVVPFTRSFDNRSPDTRLREKLEQEVAGIARWAMGGAVDLKQKIGKGENPWPISEGAERVLMDFGLENNRMDGFLADCFVKAEDGFVSNEVVRREWAQWVKRRGLSWAREMSDKIVPTKIVTEGSWGLSERRVGAQGTRGVRGLSLKKM